MDKIRCSCGCFMAVDEFTNENSGEEYEAYCNRCGKSERGLL